MTITLKSLAAIFVGSCVLMTTATSVNAAAQPNPFEREGYPSNYIGDFKNVNGYLLDRCFVTTSTEINFCSKEKAKSIAKMTNRKPTFSKNSVLMRFWDTEMNVWNYAALNQKTKKLFILPTGLRSATDPMKNIKVTYGKNKDRLCTASTIDMIGGADTRAFRADFTGDDIVFCYLYNEKTGWDDLKRINSKTGKEAPVEDFKL